MTETGHPAARNADLGTRVISAVVMLFVAVTALSVGDWLLGVFVTIVGFCLLWEFWGLVRRFARTQQSRAFWMIGGVSYIGAACLSLMVMPVGLRWVVIVAVIAVDTGAYFAGRKFGGRKIAPAISPSKTWAGLYGGMAGAAIITVGAWLTLVSALAAWGNQSLSVAEIVAKHPLGLLMAIGVGMVLAVLAQAGDFFESWMKRRAGVKDSSSLIPGHGGFFDRLDGLLPVSIAVAIVTRVMM